MFEAVYTPLMPAPLEIIGIVFFVIVAIIAGNWLTDQLT